MIITTFNNLTFTNFDKKFGTLEQFYSRLLDAGAIYFMFEVLCKKYGKNILHITQLKGSYFVY